MHKHTVFDCYTLELHRYIDRTGNLTAVENSSDIPFDIKRIYYLYDVPGGESRGAHAHKDLQQLIVAASGALAVITKSVFGLSTSCALKLRASERE